MCLYVWLVFASLGLYLQVWACSKSGMDLQVWVCICTAGLVFKCLGLYLQPWACSCKSGLGVARLGLHLYGWACISRSGIVFAASGLFWEVWACIMHVCKDPGTSYLVPGALLAHPRYRTTPARNQVSLCVCVNVSCHGRTSVDESVEY